MKSEIFYVFLKYSNYLDKHLKAQHEHIIIEILFIGCMELRKKFMIYSNQKMTVTKQRSAAPSTSLGHPEILCAFR